MMYHFDSVCCCVHKRPNLFNHIVFHGVYSVNYVKVLLSSVTLRFLFVIMGVVMEKITDICLSSSVSKVLLTSLPLNARRQFPKTAISVDVNIVQM